MIVELDPVDQERAKAWDAYVYSSPFAGHGHLVGWRRVVERSYGHRCTYLIAEENGVIRGILPLVLIQSRLFGRSLVSLPFLDEGGICSQDERSRDELYREAYRLFGYHKADCLDLRHRHPSGLDLSSHAGKVTLVLELPDDPQRLWEGFDPKLRNQIRKALKSDLAVSWYGLEGLSDFYGVFANNMRDLGSPVHSRGFFEAILNEFPDSAKLVLVRQEKRTIGGGLCLLYKNTFFMPWASSLRSYLSLCPNSLLYWEAIRWACEKGYKRFDFGRSSPGGGTYRFKKQWGAQEAPLHWQFLSSQGRSAPVLQTDDLRYRWALQVWRRLPLSIANRVGPFLRKQISN